MTKSTLSLFGIRFALPAFRSVLRLALGVVVASAGASGAVAGQQQGTVLDGLARYFEVSPAAMEAAQQDSLRILAEINRDGRRTIPVSHPTDQQQRCRAAAVIVSALAARIVTERGWTEDVEVHVTCRGYQSTMVLNYPDSLVLTDRRLPDGTVLFSKTLERPPGADQEE